ncbi:MAG: GNAT family N-acetyltransferase [Caldilinea sp.]|nr:GNAT family N-acetyltransferase [Caldilinea sp.]MDW8440290.1 GNAT family protein [Caldilineaceae bacterium]
MLPEEMLARRNSLPLKPAAVTLVGRFVRLEPLSRSHAPTLYRHSNGSSIELAGRSFPAYDPDELIWRYLFVGPFADLASFERYIDELICGADRLALCVIDQASDQPVGVVNLMSNAPMHLRIELGGIWFSPVVQRTQANLESAHLMLSHCFALGYRRVEWKCDSRNERSQRAALRIGFTFEGIQEHHMIVKGQSRDTAWFRMLEHEWPTAKARLEAMLYGRC